MNNTGTVSTILADRINSETAVKSLFDKYEKLYEREKYEQLMEFYHPEAVVVHRGSKCFYGQNAILRMFKEFSSKAGKCKAKVSVCIPREECLQCVNNKFTGMGDFVIVTCDCETQSENLGPLKGCLVQIWRKEGANWTIFHDEFTAVNGHFCSC